MPRETLKAKRTRALAVAQQMEALYLEADCALAYSNPFSLLVAVMLSAQTTDSQVNQVTPELFRRWPDASNLAVADPAAVAEVIKQLGLYKVKARHAVQAAQALLADFGGQVPQTMAELTRLPGVGRKTANIVLNLAFGTSEGIAVDTHVFRIAHKLGFAPSAADTADKVEQALMRLYPASLWGEVNSRWVLFGREYCVARQPRCSLCPLAGLCPSAVK